MLGQSEYGLLQLVSSIISCLSFLNLGLSVSYLKFYASVDENDRKHQIARLNGMVMILFAVLGLIALVCGLILTLNLQLVFDRSLSPQELYKSRILMTVLSLNLGISLVSTPFQCYVRASERFVYMQLLNIVSTLISPFTGLIFLALGYGSIGLVMTTLLISLGRTSVNLYYSFQKLKMEFDFRNPDFKLLKSIGVFTFFVFINQVIDQLNIAMDKSIVTVYCGVDKTAIYSVGSQFNMYYGQFVSTILTVFELPVTMAVVHEPDRQKVNALFARVGRICTLICGLLLSGFILFGRDFILLWAGKEYGQSYLVALCLLIPVTIPLIQGLGPMILRAQNRHRTTSIVYCGLGIFNILISIVLVQIFGPVGAALGTGIALILGNGLWINWYYHHYCKLDIPGFWKQIMKLFPGILMTVCAGIGMLLFLNRNSWKSLILQCFIYAGIYVFILWNTGMDSYEKNRIRQILSRWKRKERIQ